MKKIIASAVGLMMVGGVAASASAVEHQFGGYWRTRAFYQNEFNQDGESFSRVDNRTRLYYTAKFNDDFKFVNKFEFNTNWGKANGGSVGADGTSIWRIKNSYADFNLGNVNTKVGIFASVLARGFIFDDDHSGIVITPKFGAGEVPFGLIAVKTEDGGGEDYDEWLGFISPSFAAGENLTLNPYFVYWGAGKGSDEDGMAVGDVETYYIGIDADMKLSAASVWGTAIYNGGDIADQSVNGYLFAAGAEAGIAHGQIFYASGDANRDDGDLDGFQTAPGVSYYWSEILGLGIFDNTGPVGSPTNAISNVYAANVGVTFKPADKIKLVGDIWYAGLAEDDPVTGEDELGIEIDGKLVYKLMDNLSADVVLAYLFAGDAIGDEDVFEGGVRLSLRF